MPRESSCKMDGKDVVQTTAVYDDKGALQRENVIRLGNREIVLGQLEESVAQAERDRNGLSKPATAKPPPPRDGDPGTEVTFWLEGRNVYRCETRRDAKGKVTSCQSRLEGPWVQRLENAEERLAELTENRDQVRDAK